LFPGPTASTPRASVRSIQRLFERLRVAAGLTKRVTPHSLRHATATEAIGRGVSLPDTAALMRHARIETTMIYVAIASNARRVAATRIGAAIPRSILPRGDATTKPSTEGGHDAVDAEHELRDAA
jgi:integrase